MPDLLRETISDPAVRLHALEALSEFGHDAVLTVDADRRISGWSHRAQLVFGRTSADALRRDLLELFPEHLAATIGAILDRAAAGDRIDHVTTEARRRDGMPVPISLSVAALDGERADHRLVIVCRDCTEQHLAQARLAEMSALLHEADSLAGLGRWLWDVHTDSIQWNAQMHELHGVDADSFEGTLDAHIEVVAPHDRAGVRSALIDAATSGRALDIEYDIEVAGHGIRHLHASAESSLGSDGGVLGLRGRARVVDRSR